MKAFDLPDMKPKVKTFAISIWTSFWLHCKYNNLGETNEHSHKYPKKQPEDKKTGHKGSYAKW